MYVDPDGNALKKINRVRKANCLKRLVSKKKHRIENEYFDLDMAFITKRVIAMGYPSTGCESVYRNTLEDTKNFLSRYQPEYKVYNLCIEEGRIYPKENFTVTTDNGSIVQKKVALFPFLDHQPCPIKLMLQTMTDLCLYLIRNPNAVAALHCKAGKGRTGMMIVCYLIFSGLCKTIDEAITHYAKQRTKNHKGITIPSQIRYLQYFEAFCNSHFSWPYYKCIPLIRARFITSDILNILREYLNQLDYFFTPNYFHFLKVKIGPFKSRQEAKVQFCSINAKKMGFEKFVPEIVKEGNGYTVILDLENGPSFNCDVKLTCSCFMFNFYLWINLYYTTLENLTAHIEKILNIENKYGKAISIGDADNIEEEEEEDEEIVRVHRPSIIRLEKILTDDLSPSKPKGGKKSKKGSLKDELTNEESSKNECNTAPLIEEEIDTKNNPKTSLLSEETPELINTSENVVGTLNSIFRLSKRVEFDKELDDHPTKNFKEMMRDTLKQMNDTFRECQDLMPMIKQFNKNAKEMNVDIFDYKNQKLILTRNQLDKFKDKLGKTSKNDFQVEFNFCLEDQKRETVFGKI